MPASVSWGTSEVAVFEDVGDLVVETLVIAVADHVDEQLFGPAETHALDEQEDSAPPTRCSLAALDLRSELCLLAALFSPSAVPRGQYATPSGPRRLSCT